MMVRFGRRPAGLATCGSAGAVTVAAAAMATEITVSKEAQKARERGRETFAQIRPTLPSVPRADCSFGKPVNMLDQAEAATRRMESARGR